VTPLTVALPRKGGAASSGAGSCPGGGGDPERPARVQKETGEQYAQERFKRREVEQRAALVPSREYGCDERRDKCDDDPGNEDDPRPAEGQGGTEGDHEGEGLHRDYDRDHLHQGRSLGGGPRPS
jgi:hypothetical protein